MYTLFRWAGALLFFVSLLSMPAMYVLRWGNQAADVEGTIAAAAVNVALFTVFALHHSIMARSGAKQWLTRVVPPAMERSVYVWIASLLFLAVCWYWRPLPGVVWDLHGAGVLLYSLQAAGVVLTLAAARMVGISELAGLTQPDPHRPIEFRAAGPFALVRHPIYLGWILLVFPTPLMTASRFMFAAVSTAYLVVAIPWEEASLVAAFGEKYSAYQKQMRWRLIPGVW